MGGDLFSCLAKANQNGVVCFNVEGGWTAERIVVVDV
jgi:hypothetical protein